MMWQVMNGNEINFWKDRWIPKRDIKGFMIEGREDNQKVADFIDEERRWKLE